MIDNVANERISGNKETHYRWIDYVAGTGRYRWLFGNGDNWINSTTQGWTLPVGECFYLAYVVDWENGWAKVYLDTIEKSSITFAAGAVAGNTNNLYIGSFSPTEYLWLGKHGEVRIYNRALSPQEILDHYIIGKEMFG